MRPAGSTARPRRSRSSHEHRRRTALTASFASFTRWKWSTDPGRAGAAGAAPRGTPPMGRSRSPGLGAATTVAGCGERRGPRRRRARRRPEQSARVEVGEQDRPRLDARPATLVGAELAHRAERVLVDPELPARAHRPGGQNAGGGREQGRDGRPRHALVGRDPAQRADLCRNRVEKTNRQRRRHPLRPRTCSVRWIPTAEYTAAPGSATASSTTTRRSTRRTARYAAVDASTDAPMRTVRRTTGTRPPTPSCGSSRPVVRPRHDPRRRLQIRAG